VENSMTQLTGGDWGGGGVVTWVLMTTG
jgi:hypothetical protein